MYCANLHSFFINFVSYRLVFWYNTSSSLLCKKTIKSHKFSCKSLCRLWLNFWNYCFKTISRAISIFWILFCCFDFDFLIRALSKKVLFLNFVSVIVILFRSSLIFFSCFLFVEFNFSFQWRLLNNFTIFLELLKSNECSCFFLIVNCFRASIVERSVILIKHFFRDMF